MARITVTTPPEVTALDPDLDDIADLSPDDDQLLQYKDGEWDTRDPAQVRDDMALAKDHVGLDQVDNTADVDKPVSTAVGEALDNKQPLDDDLTDIAGLAPNDDDLIQRKGGVWTTRTPAQVKVDLAIADAAMPPIVLPEDYDYLAWTFDPVHMAGATLRYPYTGVVHFTEVVLRQAQTITNIVTYQAALGTGLANCFVGLYNRAGTSKLAESANVSATFTSGANSIKTLPLTTPYAAAAGIYKVGFLIGSETDSPTWGIAAEFALTGDPVNHGAATTRMGYATASGLTALPASLGTLSAYAKPAFWMALS
jgi:hypothetical protein